MRMDPAGRPHKWNTFQQRLGRMRPDFNVISWHSPRDARSNVPTSVVLAKLQPWHVEMNTTRGLTPGLLVPELGEDGGRIPLPDYEDGRGYGREFAKRQITTAGPIQTRSKRTRNSKPGAEAARPSPGSMDDTSEDSFEEEDGQPPQPKAKRGRRAPIRSSTPASPPGRTTPHAQQSRVLGTQLPMSTPADQYQQFARVNPSSDLAPNPPRAVAMVDRRGSLRLGQNAQGSHSAKTQPPMGITPEQSQHFAGVSPDAYLAPYPPNAIAIRGGPGPLRQISTTQVLGHSTIDSANDMAQHPPGTVAFPNRSAPPRPLTTTQLLGRRSTDSTNVIGFSVIGHSNQRPPYHPFTRMDIRNSQRARLPLLPHLPAGAPPATPTTSNPPEESTLRHFRHPGPAPFLTQPEADTNIGDARNNSQGYVDPLLERIFKH